MVGQVNVVLLSQAQAKSEAARKFGRDSMFVLQAIEDAEAIKADDDALPSYMVDRSLWIFPSGCKPRQWSAKLLAFWYYRVSVDPCSYIQAFS